MSAQGIGQILVYSAILIALAVPLGRYMAWVYTRERHDVVERGIFRLFGRRSGEEQDWKSYGKTVIVFSLVFTLLLYAIQRLQGHLFLNPDHLKGVSAHIALNTTASFVTNTNWQYYGGEYTMSYLSQIARWPGSRCRTSCPQAWGWRCSPPSCVGSHGGRAPTWATSGATCTARSSTSCCRCRSLSR